MKLTSAVGLVALIASVVSSTASLSAAEIPLRAEELPTKLGVGYAVRLLDMNGDKKLDICIVDQTRILWLENPTWKEHILIDKQTRPDNVCFAPADIDGDGHLDFAVGADWKPFNTMSGGTVQWITVNKSKAVSKKEADEANPDRLWNVHPISEVPTVHRMNFADLDGDGKPELIVAPLMGRGTKAPDWKETTCQLLSFKIPTDPVKGPWEPTVIDDKLHVTHNFQVTDFNHDGKPDILYVGFEGVSLLTKDDSGKWVNQHVGEGNQKTAPNRGASEIKHGRLGKTGDYIATIEPWHGNQVVVYTKPTADRPATGNGLWNRQVVDEELKWGHAVWCANMDDDEEEELIIGIRDELGPTRKSGVRIYDPQDTNGHKWQRQFVDDGGVAVEDLAVADLNGDGKNDIVAVGRATHNVKIYWNGK